MNEAGWILILVNGHLGSIVHTIIIIINIYSNFYTVHVCTPRQLLMKVKIPPASCTAVQLVILITWYHFILARINKMFNLQPQLDLLQLWRQTQGNLPCLFPAKVFLGKKKLACKGCQHWYELRLRVNIFVIAGSTLPAKRTIKMISCDQYFWNCL